MQTPDQAGKTAVDHLKDRIELLETRLRHMQNDFEITRTENEKSTESYLEIMANLENLVAERTEELEIKSAQLQVMIDSTPSLFMLIDCDGRYRQVNRAFAKLVGLDYDDIIGRTIRQIQPDQNPKFATRNLRVIQTGKPLLQSEEIFHAGNKRLRLLIDRKPSYCRDGKPRGVVCFALDVTETREEEQRRCDLERQLRQRQKMEAIGVLAGGIAHDFNNILSIIIGYADLIATEDKSMDEAKNHAREALNASMRARDLVRQILTFSQQNEMDRKPLMVSQVAKEVLRIIRASLPSSIEMKIDIDSKAIALIDPMHLQQVLMNLCANAWKAMQDGKGLLEVTLKDQPTDKAPERVAGAAEADEWIMLKVRDTGCGIEPEIQERIFEPYFSTDSKHDSSGMGLSIVHGVVSAAGGVIDVDSKPGKGAAFTVWLPAVDEQKPIIESPMRPQRKCDGDILLIDDEEQLLKMQKEALLKYGYNVCVMDDSEAACEMFADDPERFDVVVTDLTMPKMNGLELAMRMRQLRPKTPIILCTGYSDRVAPDCITDGLIDRLMLKPLFIAHLVGEIESLLQKSRQEKVDVPADAG